MSSLDVPKHLVVVLCVLSFLVKVCHLQHKQVAARSNDDDGCFPDQCDLNQFCCDGECCSNFARNWFAWSILMVLLFTIIFTCLCVPRLPWTRGTTDPIHYQQISPEAYLLYDTTSYKQQPTVPQYHSLATEEDHLSKQPYRYERLVQQSTPVFNYPEPSAPPKSP